MPRIAASLGVVVVVAACIGFNTMRYPVVREMVAASHQLPQLGQASKPVETLAAKAPSTDGKTPAAATPLHPGYICTGDVCRIATAQEIQQAAQQPAEPLRPVAPAVATEARPAQPARSPVAAATPATAKPEGSSAQPVPAEPQSAIGMLVPVARPDVSSSPAQLPRASQVKSASTSQQLASAAGVRRLPTIDSAEAYAADASGASIGDQVPIYPTTTTRHSWR